MEKVSAIVYRQHGAPLDVLEIESQTLRPLQPGEALVEMRFAPINPADLNAIGGKYPMMPELPATPGVEGAGVVREIAGGDARLKKGAHVLLPHGVGSWREMCIVPADQLVVVPDEIPLEEAAMLKINPATAWHMLHDFVELKSGDWLVQNAANSAVGRAVIQIARMRGIKTVNIVRREELIAELKAEGADEVLIESAEIPAQIATLTDGAKIALGLNAVGGDSALNIANSLAPGGTLVTYGAMGRQPMRIPNGLLIFQNLSFRGFWVSKWYLQATDAQKNALHAELFSLLQRGILRTKIENTYPITEFKNAIKRAQEGGRDGKILFRFNE